MTSIAPTPPAPPPGPALSGRDINLAASATRRVLIASLGPLDVTFEQWTVVNQVGSGSVTDEAALRAALGRGLQLSDAELDDLLDSLDGTVARAGGVLSLTDAGADLFVRGSTIVAEIISDLYAGFSPDDLSTVHDVLTELTARAEARLAAA